MDSKAYGDGTIQDIERRATELVRQAGQMAVERFQLPLHVEFKRSDRADPVTQADREIEGFLRSAIGREFPGHAILGEEGVEVEATERDFLWVLDPVDGTTNFMNGLPLFACSAALLRRGEPVVGAIFLSVAPHAAGSAPASSAGGETHRAAPQLGSAVVHARLGGGTFLEGDPVRASDAPTPEPSSLAGLPGHHAYQFRKLRELQKSPGEVRSLGSICLETALVACGVLRYAVYRGPKLWDVAAGTLIVREAGGLALGWRKGRWEPLTRFDAMENPAKRGEMGLRFWRMPMLVGGPQVTPFVAARLQPKVSLRSRMRKAIGNLPPWRR